MNKKHLEAVREHLRLQPCGVKPEQLEAQTNIGFFNTREALRTLVSNGEARCSLVVGADLYFPVEHSSLFVRALRLTQRAARRGRELVVKHRAS